MDKIRIGVLCPSEIAFRRFLPSLKKTEQFHYVGVACATQAEWSGGNNSDQVVETELLKANQFAEIYGGKVFEGYEQMLTSTEMDSIYIPLPPALHFNWAKKALKCGKHVFVEKPSTTSEKDTRTLIELAKVNDLALHENYMFQYHSQLDTARELIKKGEIGELRLVRIAFGFPKRSSNDFRYNKALGGGALLDCGGYTVKLATLLLGSTASIVTSRLNYTHEFDVDLYGSATLENNDGVVAQIAFGMDNAYKCELELWGSKGSIIMPRVFTAPAGLEPSLEIRTADGVKSVALAADDQFLKSIEMFRKVVKSKPLRMEQYESIFRQMQLVEQIQRKDVE